MNAITLKELNTRYDYNFSLNNLLLTQELWKCYSGTSWCWQDHY